MNKVKARVVFLGGKSLGLSVFQTLIKTSEVKLVVSNPSDRDKTKWFPSLKPIANKNKIEYTTENVNNLLEKIKKIKPDFIVCAYYDRILKDSILNLPRFDAINLHMGLSHEYQGCWPTTMPIIDGKDCAGVTLHSMTTKVDAGAVYANAIVTIDETESGKSLYLKCVGAGSALFYEKWPLITTNKLKPKPLPKSAKPKHFSRSDFPSHEVSLSWSSKKLDRHVRALTFPPFPKPYFVCNGNKFEIDYNI